MINKISNITESTNIGDKYLNGKSKTIIDISERAKDKP